MRFACDAMLGRLARWLRSLGFDTFYEPDVRRHRLLRIAREENRFILTRAHDFRQLKDIPSFHLIHSQDPKEQLKELFKQWPRLSSERHPFSRCLECNRLLEPLAAEEARQKVPHGVAAAFHEFHACPSCRKTFWKGGHVERLTRLLEGVLAKKR